jgi:hypothetical protein
MYECLTYLSKFYPETFSRVQQQNTTITTTTTATTTTTVVNNFVDWFYRTVLKDIHILKLNSVACSPQANYTERAAAAC